MYTGLATLSLAAFGRVRALRTRCGPSELAIAPKKRKGVVPPCYCRVILHVCLQSLVDHTCLRRIPWIFRCWPPAWKPGIPEKMCYSNVLSNVPRDIKCSAQWQRKTHDNSMYDFACRCTNDIIPSKYRNLLKNHAHRRLGGGEAAASLLYASTLMRFRKNACY